MQLVRADSIQTAAERSEALERGNILFFPQTPFEFAAEDRRHLLSAVQKGGGLHKNISYKPRKDKVSGLGEVEGATPAQVHIALRNFSESAVQFAADLLPQYAAAWTLDYASFRGIEESGRNLPWKKRNDLLHTDAFPTRPTRGGLILRFFANIHPSKERVWRTSEPFQYTAEKYAFDAGLRSAASGSDPLASVKRLAGAIGLPVTNRTRYDEFMLCFHDYLKKNEAFQRESAKYTFHFPPGSAWMVFTDVVPHAVLSGQGAVEQTFVISHKSLSVPSLAPVRILERLSGRSLV